MWTSFCSELVLLEDVSIVVQSGLDRSHSQTSHIKYEDSLFFLLKRSFRKQAQKRCRFFSSRGLGRHLGLRQNALSVNDR